MVSTIRERIAHARELRVIASRCMGCEMCARVCAQIHGFDRDPDKKRWNIILKNGKAVILNPELCTDEIDFCKVTCLEQCPTKALSSEVLKLSR
ncbi:MAG: hypothetical protein ACTSU5_07825 [Promethearchaeota archaeon]